MEDPNSNPSNINVLARDTFATDAGQRLLDQLRKQFLDRPSWRPDEPSSRGYFREGQNDVVRQLLTAFEAGVSGE